MTEPIVDDIGRINEFLASVDKCKFEVLIPTLASLCRVVLAHEAGTIQIEWPRDFLTILGSLDMSDDARTVVHTLLCKAVDAGKALARGETAR